MLIRSVNLLIYKFLIKKKLIFFFWNSNISKMKIVFHSQFSILKKLFLVKFIINNFSTFNFFNFNFFWFLNTPKIRFYRNCWKYKILLIEKFLCLRINKFLNFFFLPIKNENFNYFFFLKNINYFFFILKKIYVFNFFGFLKISNIKNFSTKFTFFKKTNYYFLFYKNFSTNNKNNQNNVDNDNSTQKIINVETKDQSNEISAISQTENETAITAITEIVEKKKKRKDVLTDKVKISKKKKTKKKNLEQKTNQTELTSEEEIPFIPKVRIIFVDDDDKIIIDEDTGEPITPEVVKQRKEAEEKEQERIIKKIPSWVKTEEQLIKWRTQKRLKTLQLRYLSPRVTFFVSLINRDYRFIYNFKRAAKKVWRQPQLQKNLSPLYFNKKKIFDLKKKTDNKKNKNKIIKLFFQPQKKYQLTRNRKTYFLKNQLKKVFPWMLTRVEKIFFRLAALFFAFNKLFVHKFKQYPHLPNWFLRRFLLYPNRANWAILIDHSSHPLLKLKHKFLVFAKRLWKRKLFKIRKQRKYRKKMRRGGKKKRYSYSYSFVIRLQPFYNWLLSRRLYFLSYKKLGAKTWILKNRIMKLFWKRRVSKKFFKERLKKSRLLFANYLLHSEYKNLLPKNKTKYYYYFNNLFQFQFVFSESYFSVAKFFYTIYNFDGRLVLKFFDFCDENQNNFWKFKDFYSLTDSAFLYLYIRKKIHKLQNVYIRKQYHPSFASSQPNKFIFNYTKNFLLFNSFFNFQKIVLAITDPAMQNTFFEKKNFLPSIDLNSATIQKLLDAQTRFQWRLYSADYCFLRQKNFVFSFFLSALFQKRFLKRVHGFKKILNLKFVYNYNLLKKLKQKIPNFSYEEKVKKVCFISFYSYRLYLFYLIKRNTIVFNTFLISSKVSAFVNFNLSLQQKLILTFNYLFIAVSSFTNVFNIDNFFFFKLIVKTRLLLLTTYFFLLKNKFTDICFINFKKLIKKDIFIPIYRFFIFNYLARIRFNLKFIIYNYFKVFINQEIYKNTFIMIHNAATHDFDYLSNVNFFLSLKSFKLQLAGYKFFITKKFFLKFIFQKLIFFLVYFELFELDLQTSKQIKFEDFKKLDFFQFNQMKLFSIYDIKSKHFCFFSFKKFFSVFKFPLKLLKNNCKKEKNYFFLNFSSFNLVNNSSELIFKFKFFFLYKPGFFFFLANTSFFLNSTVLFLKYNYYDYFYNKIWLDRGFFFPLELSLNKFFFLYYSNFFFNIFEIHNIFDLNLSENFFLDQRQNFFGSQIFEKPKKIFTDSKNKFLQSYQLHTKKIKNNFKYFTDNKNKSTKYFSSWFLNNNKINKNKFLFIKKNSIDDQPQLFKTNFFTKTLISDKTIKRYFIAFCFYKPRNIGNSFYFNRAWAKREKFYQTEFSKEKKQIISELQLATNNDKLEMFEDQNFKYQYLTYLKPKKRVIRNWFSFLKNWNNYLSQSYFQKNSYNLAYKIVRKTHFFFNKNFFFKKLIIFKKTNFKKFKKHGYKELFLKIFKKVFEKGNKFSTYLKSKFLFSTTTFKSSTFLLFKKKIKNYWTFTKFIMNNHFLNNFDYNLKNKFYLFLTMNMFKKNLHVLNFFKKSQLTNFSFKSIKFFRKISNNKFRDFKISSLKNFILFNFVKKKKNKISLNNFNTQFTNIFCFKKKKKHLEKKKHLTNFLLNSSSFNFQLSEKEDSVIDTNFYKLKNFLSKNYKNIKNYSMHNKLQSFFLKSKLPLNNNSTVFDDHFNLETLNDEVGNLVNGDEKDFRGEIATTFDINNFVFKLKPGYQVIWRSYRNEYKNLAQLSFFRQYKLTAYFYLFKKTFLTNLLKTFELSLFSVLKRSNFFFDMSVSLLFLKTGSVFVNGCPINNRHFQLYSNDIVQLVCSLQYFFQFKIIFSLFQNYKYKFICHYINYFFKSNNILHANIALIDFSKNWFLKFMGYNLDTPNYLEVDFFVLSIIIIYEPFNIFEFDPIILFRIPFFSMRLYNWKYIV